MKERAAFTVALALVVALVIPTPGVEASPTWQKVKDPPMELASPEANMAASTSVLVAHTGYLVGSRFVVYGVTCWGGATQHADYNKSYLKWMAQVFIVWCARDGKVMDNTSIVCVSIEGYFQESQKCTTEMTPAGLSIRNVYTDWGFKIGYSFATANIDVDLRMTLTDKGVYAGTWYWNG